MKFGALIHPLSANLRNLSGSPRWAIPDSVFWHSFFSFPLVFALTYKSSLKLPAVSVRFLKWYVYTLPKLVYNYLICVLCFRDVLSCLGGNGALECVRSLAWSFRGKIRYVFYLLVDSFSIVDCMSINVSLLRWGAGIIHWCSSSLAYLKLVASQIEELATIFSARTRLLLSFWIHNAIRLNGRLIDFWLVLNLCVFVFEGCVRLCNLCLCLFVYVCVCLPGAPCA